MPRLWLLLFGFGRHLAVDDLAGHGISAALQCCGSWLPWPSSTPIDWRSGAIWCAPDRFYLSWRFPMAGPSTKT